MGISPAANRIFAEEELLSKERILTRDEIRTIVTGYREIRRRSRRTYVNTFQSHIIFRLSCCAGLRGKEIACLNLGDIVGIDGAKPCIRIRKSATKNSAIGRGRGRLIPLWWDAGTAADIREWYHLRVEQIAEWYAEGLRTTGDRCPTTWKWIKREFTGEIDDEPVVCVLQSPLNANRGGRLHRRLVTGRWHDYVRRWVPESRAKQIPCHAGRHSFITHSLYSGRQLPEVRDAAGHASVATTCRYLHALDDDDVDDVFGWAEPAVNGKRAPLRRSGKPRMTSVEVPQLAVQKILKWAERREVPKEDALLEAIRVALKVERDKQRSRTRAKRAATLAAKKLAAEQEKSSTAATSTTVEPSKPVGDQSQEQFQSSP